MFVLELLSAAALAGASPALPQRMTEIMAEEATVVEAPFGDEDLCAIARRIAGAAPCLDPESCRALELWQGVFGVPGVRPADPEFGGGRFGLSPRLAHQSKPGARGRPRRFGFGPRTLDCLAERAPAGGAERAGDRR
ncbi:MAG: hypothetical protein GY769_22385 [bacterium]|nr:hypothetical protein [bacterium]